MRKSVHDDVWTVEISSDLAWDRTPNEDGEMRTVEWFRVRVYNQFGQRFEHFKVVLKHEVPALEAMVKKIEAKKNFTPVNNPYWTEGYPVYGSEYYCVSGGDRVHMADLEPELNAPSWEAGQRMVLEREWLENVR